MGAWKSLRQHYRTHFQQRTKHSLSCSENGPEESSVNGTVNAAEPCSVNGTVNASKPCSVNGTVNAAEPCSVNGTDKSVRDDSSGTNKQGTQPPLCALRQSARDGRERYSVNSVPSESQAYRPVVPLPLSRQTHPTPLAAAAAIVDEDERGLFGAIIR